MVSNGGSTGFAPIHVRIAIVLTSVHILIFLVGENFVDFFVVFTSLIMIMIEAPSAITPPSFEGIDRRIA